MERGTTPLLLVLQFSDRVNMCPVRRSGGYIKKKKIKKMTSSGGHNFVDYTMHSVRGASLEPVKESFVSWLWGIVTLSTGFCRRKKNSSPRRDEVFFSRLWFIFPYHAGDPARYNRTTIYYTLRDQSMGKTRDLFLPRSFPSNSVFLYEKTIGDLVAQGLLLWLLFRRQCYYPERQEIREEKLVVLKVRSVSE